MERFSLRERPGCLRLVASKPISADRGKLRGAFWGAPNTLSQRHLGVGKTRMEAKLDLAGFRHGTCAGITHFSGHFRGYEAGLYALFGVRQEAGGRRVLFFADQRSATEGPEIGDAIVHLRSDTDFDRATFSWSLNGEIWNETEYRYRLGFGSWRGNRSGLFCWNSRTDDPAEAGQVDVDWFRYTPSER